MPDAPMEVYNVCCYNKGSEKFSVQRTVYMGSSVCTASGNVGWHGICDGQTVIT